MSFLWPDALWLLLLGPAAVFGYLLLLRRRKRFAVRHSNASLVREALGARSLIRPHVPPFLLLLALFAALLATARPIAEITLPSEQRTIMLAMDVSLSMRATDVSPNRMVASQAAAKAFVLEQPEDVRIGIVTFAAAASLVQPPTRDRDALIAAIDAFKMQVHTAMGSGIVLALATLFPEDGLELELEHTPSGASSRTVGRELPSKGAAKSAPAKPRKEHQPVVPGSNLSSAIILLTDGRRTIGADALDAARLAAARGIRVYTVGFGSASSAPVSVDGYSIYMQFDEEVLKAIAGITKAEYFHAASVTELKRVYQELNARYVLERSRTEVSALFAALAATLVAAAATLSTFWFARLG